MRAIATAACCLFTVSLWAQPARDPAKLLHEADRLAWLRAWNAAEPLYLEAERLFDAVGDKRNALYAASVRSAASSRGCQCQRCPDASPTTSPTPSCNPTNGCDCAVSL